MKRILTSAFLLLCLCFALDTVAQNYDKLSPLTLLNRSILYHSKKAIERDEQCVMSASRLLIASADEVMYHSIPASSTLNKVSLQQVASDVYCLGLAYYMSDDERYAERAKEYTKLWLLNPNTRITPQATSTLNYSDMTCMLMMLDGFLLADTNEFRLGNTDDYEAMQLWWAEYLLWLRSDEVKSKVATLDDYQAMCYDMLFTTAKTCSEREWLSDMRDYLNTTTKGRLAKMLGADGQIILPENYNRNEVMKSLITMAHVGELGGSNLWLYVTPEGGSIRKTIDWYYSSLMNDRSWLNTQDAAQTIDACVYTLLTAACPLTSKKLYEERLNALASMTEGKDDICAISYQLTTPIIYGTLLSDAEFFEELNLDYPGLETVKADVASGNISKAKTDFVDYLRHREYRFDWNNADNSKDAGSYDLKEVTNTVNNLLMGEQFGDTVIWTRNSTPLEYEEWPWQLSRHQYWIGLGRAYKATGNEQYARAFVNQLNSWIDQSPLPDYDAKIDYSRWRTIEAGIRTLGAWPMAYLNFLQSPSFDDESVFLMLKSFYEHAIHLRLHHRTNNWLSMEMNGLIHIALIFPEFKESAHWAKYAGEKIYQETENQVYPDGAQVELTPGYHATTLSNFLGLYSIAQVTGYEGLPKNFGQKLVNMYNYFVKIVAPSGEVPAVNDSGWNDVRPTLTQGFGLFPERTDFQYIATEGKDGVKPDYTSTWMPWAGWYMMRSGWGKDDLYTHFEVGPYSPGHQHEDKLSVILYAYGKRLITEGATYSYDTSDWRKYILSARAHNISKVDGKYQNRHDYEPEEDLEYSRQPMENRWVSNEDCDFGEGWYNEGFGDEAGKADRNVEQYRALTFIKNKYWILFDIFTPKDEASHEYDTYFHFNTDRYLTEGNTVMSNDEGANIAIVPLRNDAKTKVVCGQKEPELQGWIPEWTNDGYVYNPVATPTFSYYEPGQSVSAYILYPLKPDETNPVKSVKAKDGKVEIRFANGEKDVITYSVEGKQMKTLDFKSKKKQFTILK